MQYIGMDVHKTTTMICLLDENDVMQRPFRVATTAEALQAFARALPEPGRVALEATRNHAFLHDLLQAEGLEVVVAHPKAVEAISSCKKKSDRHDAITLAKLLKADLLPRSYVPPLEIRYLRELVREYLRLGAIRVRAKNWLRAILAQEGLVCPYSDLMGKRAQAWLDAVALPPTRRQIVTRCRELLAWVRTHRTQVEQEIIEYVKDDPQVKRLLSLPGVGYLLAAAVRAEIGDIRRFPSHRPLCSYAGLVTTTRESAGIVRHGHITKEGATVLRWALCMGVTHLIRKPGPVKEFYGRVSAKHGKKSARTAAARKLLCYIFAMLTQQTEYKYSGSPAGDAPADRAAIGIGEARFHPSPERLSS